MGGGDHLDDGVIRLRPLVLTDATDWLAGQDQEQIRWFQFPRPATEADVVVAIERWSESWRTGGPVRHWGVRDVSDDRLLGGVELHDLGDGIASLSYVVFPKFRRRRIATRAARLALTTAPPGTHRVRIAVLEGNTASLGVARRLGAVEAGTEPSDQGPGTFIVLELALDPRPTPRHPA